MTEDIYTLSKVELLARKVPEQLYSNDRDLAKQEYRKLSMKWHPDRGGDNNAFQHVKELYEEALKKFDTGLWVIPNVIQFKTINDKKYEVHYKKKHTFELGDMYISDTVVMYMVDKKHKDLVDNSLRRIKSFTYHDDKMKAEVSRYLPEIKLSAETTDHYVIIYSKTPDLLLLKDVISHLGAIPVVHVAWVLSSLYNLACYLSYTGISHNSISPDTYFISPKYHSGALLGGWWYSTPIGQKLIAAPKRTIIHCPTLIKTKVSSNADSDINLINVTGLEMLGDEFGSKLLMKSMKDPSGYPSTMINWLRSPIFNSTAIKIYKQYKDSTLAKCFGKLKFHELKLTASELYE